VITVEQAEDSCLIDFYRSAPVDTKKDFWNEVFQVPEPQWQDYLAALEEVYAHEEKFRQIIIDKDKAVEKASHIAPLHLLNQETDQPLCGAADGPGRSSKTLHMVSCKACLDDRLESLHDN
jgi:hypothetical protein